MVARLIPARRVAARLLLGLGVALAAGGAVAQDRFITMASTTSTEQSGLFPHLLPAFRQATGIDVHVVAVGTGQALDIGRRGDADILFVHDRAAEEKFVAEGYGVKRLPVMYNDFVVVGPKSDPARVAGKDVVAALKKIAASKALTQDSGALAALTGSRNLMPSRVSPRFSPTGIGAARRAHSSERLTVRACLK